MFPQLRHGKAWEARALKRAALLHALLHVHATTPGGCVSSHHLRTQVKDGTGNWVDVTLAKNEVAVLVGQTAETASAGIFAAATSRVVSCACRGWQMPHPEGVTRRAAHDACLHARNRMLCSHRAKVTLHAAGSMSCSAPGLATDLLACLPGPCMLKVRHTAAADI